MPFTSKLESELNTWQIFQGPRNKRLATQHLEYLIYVLMDGTTRPIFDAVKGTITIDDCSFHLITILKAQPDFEQLSFHDLQFNVYQKEREMGDNADPSSTLHSVEIDALDTWSTSAYRGFNDLLRFYSINQHSYYGLAQICFAAHGLTKLNSMESRMHYRHEKSGTFLAERVRLSKNKQLIRHAGFTAISDRSLNGFGSTQTIFPALQHYTSLAKNIELYCHHGEEESLFPPNTEFAFLKQEDNSWHACSVRSVNYENSYAYQHNFTPQQLQKIVFHREKCRLNTAAHYLQQHHEVFGDSIKEVIGLIDLIECHEKSCVQKVFTVVHLLQNLLDTIDEKLTLSSKSKLEHVQSFMRLILEQLQFLYKPEPKAPLTLFAKRKLNRLENADAAHSEIEESISSKRRLVK